MRASCREPISDWLAEQGGIIPAPAVAAIGSRRHKTEDNISVFCETPNTRFAARLPWDGARRTAFGDVKGIGWRLEEEADAEREFLEALKRDPRQVSALFSLAKLYQEQQKFEQALREIDAAVKLAPDSGKVHFLRAQILQHLGKKDEAKLEFTTAKKLMDLQVIKDREELEERYLPNPELKQSSPN